MCNLALISHLLFQSERGIEDKSHGLDDEDRRVESDILGLEEEAAPKGQQQAAPIGFGSAPEPERPVRVSAFRQPALTTWTDPEDGMIYIDVPTYPPPAPSVQTPSSPKWPSATILVDKDQFIEVGAQLGLYWSILQDHTQRLDAMPPTLVAEIDRDSFMEARAGIGGLGRACRYPNGRYVMGGRELQEMRGRVTALEQERDRRVQ
ncbi:hypothetical protein Tco_0908313 [Tanacetum coccineum]|uniref:Uncharacterized protein n=1 Tax=Tanacetum coccineum TaxID=301880 RepID=A0ABQ5CNX5_9ASTR